MLVIEFILVVDVLLGFCVNGMYWCVSCFFDD